MEFGIHEQSSWITGSRPRHGSRSARLARRPGNDKKVKLRHWRQE